MTDTTIATDVPPDSAPPVDVAPSQDTAAGDATATITVKGKKTHRLQNAVHAVAESKTLRFLSAIPVIGEPFKDIRKAAKGADTVVTALNKFNDKRLAEARKREEEFTPVDQVKTPEELAAASPALVEPSVPNVSVSPDAGVSELAAAPSDATPSVQQARAAGDLPSIEPAVAIAPGNPVAAPAVFVPVTKAAYFEPVSQPVHAIQPARVFPAGQGTAIPTETADKDFRARVAAGEDPNKIELEQMKAGVSSQYGVHDRPNPDLSTAVPYESLPGAKDHNTASFHTSAQAHRSMSRAMANHLKSEAAATASHTPAEAPALAVPAAKIAVAEKPAAHGPKLSGLTMSA